METFSALLAICAGNSPVPGEFPAQRPLTRSFDVFYLNKRLNKQSRGWWFETPSRPLWRHRNAKPIDVDELHVMPLRRNGGNLDPCNLQKYQIVEYLFMIKWSWSKWDKCSFGFKISDIRQYYVIQISINPTNYELLKLLFKHIPASPGPSQ